MAEQEQDIAPAVYDPFVRLSEQVQNFRQKILVVSKLEKKEKHLKAMENEMLPKYEQGLRERVEGPEIDWTQVPHEIKVRLLSNAQLAEGERVDIAKPQQYSWDFVLVVQIPRKELDKKVQEAWLRKLAEIMLYLHYAKFKTYIYNSVGKDEFYILIGASEDRIAEEAERIEFEAEIVPAEAISLSGYVGITVTDVPKHSIRASEDAFAIPLAENAQMHAEEHLEAGPRNEHRVVDAKEALNYFQGVFVPYTSVSAGAAGLGSPRGSALDVTRERDEYNASLERLFKHHDKERFHYHSHFDCVSRLKLSLSIMESERVVGGAMLKLRGYVTSGKYLFKFFPLHNESERSRVKKLMTTCSLFSMPAQELRDYLGEQVALYFSFLSYYSCWLVPVAFFGAIMFGIQAYEVASGSDSDGSKVMGKGSVVVGVVMALWATGFLEFWKRKQSQLKVSWGMVNFLPKETTRVEFTPEREDVDLLTGKREVRQQFWKFVLKVTVSQSVLWTLIALVILVVVGIVALRLQLVHSFKDQPTAPIVIASVLNALQIQIFNFIYGRLSVVLNDFENHRTDTAYENALIAKSFLFKFVNSYQSLFFIAFAKQFDKGVKYCKGSYLYEANTLSNRTERDLFDNDTWLDEAAINPPTLSTAASEILKNYRAHPDYRGDCVYELAYNLFILFGMQILINNTIELGTIWASNCRKSREETPKSAVAPELTPKYSPAEEEYTHEQYPGTFSDYDELVVQFGYVVLFVVACPLAPMLALVSNVLENQIDSIKLLKMTARPHPKGAADMGFWQTILLVISYVALATNVAIITWYPTPVLPEGTTLVRRLLIFIIAEHIALILKVVIAYLVPDEPEWVEKHIHRQSVVANIYLQKSTAI